MEKFSEDNQKLAEQIIAPIVQQSSEIASSIKDDKSYLSAVAFLQRIKVASKKLDEVVGVFVDSAYTHWKNLVAERKKLEKPLSDSEELIKASIAKYADEKERQQEEERKRLEEQQKAQGKEDIQVILPPAVPKAEGLTLPKVWNAEVLSLIELVKAVAKGKAPLASVVANDKFLNQQAKSLKEEFNIPGVRAVSRTSVTVGTRPLE